MAAPKGQVPWNAGTSRGWTDKRGYRWRYITVGGKKRATREHRYIMAQSLGRALEPWEVVHHKDGNPLNNDLSNLELIEVGEHTYHHHNGSQRADAAKKSLRIYAQMREEIKHLRGVNAALLEALEATEELIGNLAEGWSKSEDAGVHISTAADLDYIRSLIRRYRKDAKPLTNKARAAIAQAKGGK